METRTITARDSSSAFAKVMDLLGPDAVIIETRKTRGGVEVVAGIERAAKPSSPQRDMGMAQAPAMSHPRGRAQKPDPMVRFIAQARAVGVDPELLSDEIARGGDDLVDVWSRFLIRVEREVAIASPPYRELAHLCIVGDSGSAKTTTLAQMAAKTKAEWPGEPIALMSGDRRPGAREQLRVIAAMLNIPVFEPNAGETLADAVVRLGGSRRLFIDMPSDPRLAACEVEELRYRFGRAGTLSVFCTLPLNGQLARHRQIGELFANEFDGYVLTHAGETLPPGAAITILLESGLPLVSVGRSAEFHDGIDIARSTSLARMIAAALSAGGSAALQ